VYLANTEQKTKNEIIKYMNIKEKEIHPIYLGVDNAWFNIEKKPHSPHNKPFLLFVGNIKIHKNLLTLLQAFNKVKHSIVHDLIIVGKREGLKTPDQNLSYECEKAKDRIIFTGFIEDDLLRDISAEKTLKKLMKLYNNFL
jgi:glycosyltransferase involved in cell wall biosynthesis